MKTKDDRKGALNKKPYVGPRVTILQPDGDEAKKLANGLSSSLPVKYRSPKTKEDGNTLGRPGRD